MLKALAAGFLISAIFLVTACSNEGNGDGANGRDGFIQDIEAQISELRDDLAQMREDIADGDAGAEIEQQADALEGRINNAEAELDKLRSAGEDEWEGLKGNVEDVVGSAGDVAEDIRKRIGID